MSESCLHIDLRVGDAVNIGGNVTVELEEKSGKVAKLKLRVPTEIDVKKVVAEPAMRGTTNQ